MKKLSLILICLFVSFELKTKELSLLELKFRDGLYYEKFSDNPYSGMVTGRVQGKIKKGKQVGKWLTFDRDGSLVKKLYYKNGKEHGESVIYSFGQIDQKSNFKNGKEHGEKIFFHPNGKIKSKSFYKNDKKHGDYIEYYTNGELELKEKYKNDKREGLSIKYNESGKIINRGYYKDDKKEGWWVERPLPYLFDISPEGDVRERSFDELEFDKFRMGNYKNGKGDGEWFFYNLYNSPECKNYTKITKKYLKNFLKNCLTKTEIYKDGKIMKKTSQIDD